MDIIKNVIDLLYYKLDFTRISYKNYEEEPISDINRLIKDLKEYENLKLLELEKEYGITIKKNI